MLSYEPVHEISNNVVCATAKPQIICTAWSEPLLVAWVYYDCLATDWTAFGVSLLEISYTGSYESHDTSMELGF